MSDEIEALLGRLREVEGELEREFEVRRAVFRYEVRKRKAVFEASVLARHREIKTGVLRFLGQSPILSIVTAPLIYGLIVPMVLLDLSVYLYQLVCFPIWGMARIRRSDYLVIDRHYLAYLNGIQKLNCVYCGYANGLVAFIEEVVARSEQFWCPIKHARRVKGSHDRYKSFLDYGDAEGFQDRLGDYRRKVRKCEECRAGTRPAGSGD